MSRVVSVQCADEAALAIAERLKALDLHAEAAALEILVADRAHAHATLDEIAGLPYGHFGKTGAYAALVRELAASGKRRP